MKKWNVVAAAAAVAVAGGICAATASAKGAAPEDILKGRIIVSDQRIPMKWNSVSSYVAQLKAMNKSTLWYDKKTGKLKIEFAAFFARAIDDVQVELVISDVTPGALDRRSPVTTEQFMNRGERVLFNSVTLDKEDFEMNRKYRFVVKSRNAVLASTEFTVRGEGPHYSGRVEFSDEEAKKKD